MSVTQSTYTRQNGQPSVVIKRSVSLDGHKTSFSLEDKFWDTLKRIQVEQNAGLSTDDPQWISLASLVAMIDHGKPEGCGVSGAIRLFIHDYMLAKIAKGETWKNGKLGKPRP